MTFDEERTAFFAAFGQALESWSSVEAHLYLIFLGCVSPAEHRVAAAIYYATVGFGTKLEITDAAVKVALEGQPELAEWEKLRKRAWRKYSKRNELAHYDVLSDPQRVQGQRFLLVDSLLDPLRRSNGTFLAEVGLGINELNKRCEVFTELAHRLRDFHKDYGKGAVYYLEPKAGVATRATLLSHSAGRPPTG
jgi:hypothetical protein